MIGASYFDGRSAAPHPVTLRCLGANLHLAGPTVERDYPLADATLAEPFAGAPSLVYFGDGAHCEIEGRAGADWLAAVLCYRKPLAVRMQERWRAAVLGLFLLAALLGAALRFGAPAAADAVVAALPASVDADRLALSSLTAAGSAALFGDLSAVAAAASAELADLQYSREMETEADDYAIATLRHLGMSTLPMADLFDGFRREEERDNGNLAEWVRSVAGYASAHPSDAERTARLRGGQAMTAPAARTVAPNEQR